ncbi:hypothetical protein FQA47_012047 [Oryzias melastigma]|uniref:Uncharacterized protein n=1 Tax=Oryzias melastigma TaxID=30732 RepID=A0A834F9I4_ORYME|nr:hypothetical protein FQA47_012047 [Oryzias melastigma]
MQFVKRQGEAKVFALLEGLDSVPEDVEVYVVLEGSTLTHVARAQSDVMLCFIVPEDITIFPQAHTEKIAG